MPCPYDPKNKKFFSQKLAAFPVLAPKGNSPRAMPSVEFCSASLRAPSGSRPPGGSERAWLTPLQAFLQRQTSDGLAWSGLFCPHTIHSVLEICLSSVFIQVRPGEFTCVMSSRPWQCCQVAEAVLLDSGLLGIAGSILRPRGSPAGLLPGGQLLLRLISAVHACLYTAAPPSPLALPSTAQPLTSLCGARTVNCVAFKAAGLLVTEV